MNFSLSDLVLALDENPTTCGCPLHGHAAPPRRLCRIQSGTNCLVSVEQGGAGRRISHVIGTSISHYRIISHLGAGGMGTVYLAEDANLSRRVALKFLPPETASNPDAAARLLREARAASALDHPHNATIYEIGDDQGRPFIAMAHYEGETLASRLARGQLPVAEIATIVVQMADALKAAHAANIVHRDLKPSNLMLTTTGQLKVLDFGLAKIETGETATQLTRAGSTGGDGRLHVARTGRR